MKILVTGVAGQLGHDVMDELARRGHEALGTDLAPVSAPWPCAALDITDGGAVRALISDARPDGVVHCAAWTAVDLAEEPGNLEKVRAVNVDGTRNIAKACREAGARMIYISTDYVFDGQGTAPWEPDCEDYRPLNVYGRSKLEGELAVRRALDRYFIVRTAWVFGLHGKNFVRAMLNAARDRDSVRVVDDQIGTPTYTFDLARLLVDMVETERYGVYHATNSELPGVWGGRTGTGTRIGYISWCDFTREIYRQAGLSTKVIPVSTAEYGLNKAARPFNSRLDKRKLVDAGFEPLPTWQDALRRYLEAIRHGAN